jgi:hypothetical protein
MRPRLSFANVVSVLALFVALGGSAYAFHLGKNSVGSRQIKKNAVTTAKIKKEAVTAGKIRKGTLTGAQINASTLGTVPTAQRSNTLAAPENWHEVGAPGEPYFENSWNNITLSPAFEHVGFYKDHEGIVHLKGSASGGTSFIIFHLPPGYRPASGKATFQLTACDGGPCSATKVGTVVVVGSGMPEEGAVGINPGATYVSFEGITFRAES